MRVQLKRVAANQDGTFGVFIIDGVPICVTLEEEQGGNQKDTAIPAGNYETETYSGTIFKDVFILKNVPNRSAILIHWGNTEDNTAGCILVGQYYANFNGKTGVAASVNTFKQLRALLPNKFTLEITDNFA
jgi:hypothetical protein